MAIISDNALDHELAQMKGLLEKTKMTQTTFSNTFQNLPPKDRAKIIKQIQADHRTLSAFIEKAKKADIHNSGTKFGLENLRQSFQTLLNLWRRTEKNLENFTTGSGPKPAPVLDETSRAVEKYVETMKSLGYQLSSESVTEFRTRLESAYEQAKARTGGKEMKINIVHDGAKIKVKLEPKG